MNKLILPGKRSGTVLIPSSKSVVHRLMICAALGTHPVTLTIDGLSKDILATADCLSALGARIDATNQEIRIQPIEQQREHTEEVLLPAGESGSTLRFLLPVVGALGQKAVFQMEGRLSSRPLAPFDRLLTEHGMHIQKNGEKLYCSGKLFGGSFTLPGNVSSQYFSGLLLALPILEGESSLYVEGDSAWVGTTVRDVEEGGRCVVTAVVRGSLVLVPKDDVVLEAGDTIIYMTL